MIDCLLHELLFTAWIAGLAGSWRLFRAFVLPAAIASCPFEFDRHEGPI